MGATILCRDVPGARASPFSFCFHMSMKSLPHLIVAALIAIAIASGFVFIRTALTGLLLFVWAGLSVRHAALSGRWLWYPMSGWMLAYLVWMGAGVWWSGVPHSSWLTAWVLAGLPIAFLAWSMTPRPDEVWAHLRGAFLLAGPAFALWGIWQVVTGYGNGQPVGPLIDKNAFAALMNVFWFFASVHFTGALHDRGWNWRTAFSALGLLLIATTLFAAESRGATLAWLLLMPAVLWAGYQYARNKRAMVAVLAIALTGYLAAAGALGLNVGHRTFNLEQDASTSARLLLWKAAVGIAEDHPVTGTGWGTFVVQYPAYRDPRENTTAGVYAHNDYLQLAAEGGIPALLLLLGICAGLLLQLKRALASPHGQRALEASGLLLGALALFLHAGLNFIFYYAFMNILAGIFAARAMQLLHPGGVGSAAFGEALSKIGRTTKAMVAGLAVLLLAGPLLLQLLAQSTLTGSQAGLVLLRTVWPGADAYTVAKFITAIRPSSGLAQEYLLRASEEALKGSDNIHIDGVDFQRELLNETLDRYELIRAQMADSPAYGVREAHALIQYRGLMGQGVALQRAGEILEQNLRLDPFHANSMIELSRLDVVEGKPQQAQQLLYASAAHVLSRRDQQLLVVEILRQRAAPRKIAELDEIEKQLRDVRPETETGKILVLPANFSEDIDVRLERVARAL